MLKRRQLGPEYKARVALASLKGEMTMSEMASKFEVHTSQITRWRKQVLEGLREIFSRGKTSSSDRTDPKLIDELYKQIGQLKVENEWFKKKSELFVP